MSRKKIISTQAISEEDEQFNVALRPRRLEECIGPPDLLHRIRIAVDAARSRSEPMEHVLLHGPPGLGKTTLAHIIAKEMNVNIKTTSGPVIEHAGALSGILTNLAEKDVLFIDEIHRMNRVVEENLYPAMEDFQLDLIVGQGPNARSIKLNIPHFTLIGATTRVGLLTSPLRDRFGIIHRLEFYTPDDLQQIVTRSANILNIHIDQQGAREIARRSRGTPRISNRLLKRVRDYSLVKSHGKVTRQSVQAALELEGIDKLGLTSLDRQYIKTIIDFYKGGPVGIEAIAATLQEETDTLVDVVEPYLLKKGMIIRTSSGRKASKAACLHLGYKV